MACVRKGKISCSTQPTKAPNMICPKYRRYCFMYAIKSDIEISHIPVLLLTALGEENNILDGLSV